MDPSRITASLLLAALGDGLGEPFENQWRPSPADIRAHFSAATPLRWTDDTVQLLVLARHLAARRGALDPDGFAAELADAWVRDPGRGYGRGARELLERISHGESWRVVAPSLFDGKGSHGNGAAMRVAPVGLLPLDLPEIDVLARASARITHAHPLAHDGAALIALAVSLALHDHPVASLCATLHPFAQTEVFRTLLSNLPVLSATPERLSSDATAAGSVPTALACYLRHPDDPEGALRLAIELGGDTDTVAAMAGAIVGARCGIVPPQWTGRLAIATEIGELGMRLADVSGGGGAQPRPQSAG